MAKFNPARVAKMVERANAVLAKVSAALETAGDAAPAKKERKAKAEKADKPAVKRGPKAKAAAPVAKRGPKAKAEKIVAKKGKSAPAKKSRRASDDDVVEL